MKLIEYLEQKREDERKILLKGSEGTFLKILRLSGTKKVYEKIKKELFNN